jgi:hypothetical protein
MKRCLAKELP